MIAPGSSLDRAGIAALIPHAGAMCLLHEVVRWSATQIECRARSHRSAEHPLRVDGRLPIWCAIEYGAQAMAVHGGLLAQAEGARAAPGFLAAVRDVTVHADRLDTVEEDLIVRAERLMADARSLLYEFSVSAGARTLAAGRAMVMLNERGSIAEPNANPT